MLFSNPTYLTALLSGLRILELFNGLRFYKKRLLESLISNQETVIFKSTESTEMAIFKSNQKKFEGDLKVKLCGKRLYPIETISHVKLLGVKIDANLNWQCQVNDLSVKLNRRANALLFKIRK